jgi:6-phosphogluconolactonase (cycloisomerase 2 family)
LSTFSINEDGTLALVQLAPSGGWSPRQFSFNKLGDMIAVGHQNNRTVVIWKRDLESGKIITEEEGGKIGEVTLSGAVVFALWDEQ